MCIMLYLLPTAMNTSKWVDPTIIAWPLGHTLPVILYLYALLVSYKCVGISFDVSYSLSIYVHFYDLLY